MVEWRGEMLICAPIPCVDFGVTVLKYLQKEGGCHLPSVLVLEQSGLRMLPQRALSAQACLRAPASCP